MSRLCLPVLVASLLCATAGCGYSGDGTSGIEGQCRVEVLGGAPGPSGELVGNGGPGRYGRAAIKVQTRGGDQTLAKTTADADGLFRIPLKPGTYRLVAVAPKPLPVEPPGPTPLTGAQPPEPIDVEVKRGAFTEVTVTFRVYAPAAPGQ
jgi:hypothetical protein